VSKIEIRQQSPDDWRTVRDVRLAALLDAPFAYGSTYDNARGFDEATWRSRLNNPDNPTFLAFDGDQAVGMDGVYVQDGEYTLVAMWVAPAARRLGVGVALTQAVIDWAAAHGARRVLLGVAEGNDAAEQLYKRLGFKLTGRSEPLHSDPSRRVFEMERDI
jgi:ribosomal protein S18 acetylase RimI-like enzyme